MIGFKETKHDKLSRELLSKSPLYETANDYYKFGAATVLNSLFEWCDELDGKEFESLTPDEIRGAFDEWLNNDKDIKNMVEKLYE